MDALRVLSMAMSVLELCILLVYYIPLTSDVPFWQWVSNSSSVRVSDWDDGYVSDLLFKNLIYRHLVTSIVGIHLLICAIFVYRLNCFDYGSYLLVFELGLMVAAWMGWALLTAEYRALDGGISIAHYTGTAVFVSSSAFYFLLMAYNVYYRYRRKAWNVLDQLAFGLAVTSFVLSVAAGVYFIVSALQKTEAFGWLFEQASFVLFVAAHLFLFVFEGLLAAKCRSSEPVCSKFMGQVRITRISL